MLNSLAYLGFHDIKAIERMTFHEYLLRFEAYQLAQIKRNEELAYQAWLNQQVQATAGSAKHPRPKFRTFKQFFDTDKQIATVRKMFESNGVNEDMQASHEQIFVQRMQEFKRLKAQGKIIPWQRRTQAEKGGF